MDVILPRGSTAPRAAHHGHHATAAAPGMVAHGERDYLYPNAQRAATLWYHDHRHGFTAPAVWHGLAGFHLITDDEEQALPLPSGDRDIPLLIADRSFDADGSFAYPFADPTLRAPGVTDRFMNGVLRSPTRRRTARWWQPGSAAHSRSRQAAARSAYRITGRSCCLPKKRAARRATISTGISVLAHFGLGQPYQLCDVVPP
ncbi:multicopper oxidase domain-containing protein [Nocardia sp. NPDC051463]|uniref:multicopper oxidase domain-containing protein n=1 Tax=Nocardia sp. NPDC051463 TaxID=3154845 RepID=UPI00344D3B92